MFSFAGYHLYQELYKSQNSFIYRAKHAQEPVILKIFTHLYPTSLQLASIQKEYEMIRYLNLLTSPNDAKNGVITAYELFQTDRWVMVLEDFGGDSLADLGVIYKSSIVDFIHLAINLTQTLAQVHQKQVCHCNINPSNIVLNQKTGQVKLIDFGHAMFFSDRKPTFFAPHSLENQWAYISPEQTGRMNQDIDYRTDFYSLGITFYELLTGQLPFICDDPLVWVHYHLAKTPIAPHHLISQIPLRLSELIMKLLIKNPNERYQSTTQIQTDLELCLQQLS